MQYSVKQLAKLAGITVRTLHHYDRIGLLKPAHRAASKYRYYGQAELLRLQQILFYRELDFTLSEIAGMLDDPGFDLLGALAGHKNALQLRKKRIDILLQTIDKTIDHLKQQNMLTPEELYEGLPKEKGAAYRSEALKKYGEKAVETAENYLRSMGKTDFEALKAEQKAVTAQLAGMIQEKPDAAAVQQVIARHYDIIRKFWGTHGSADKQAEAYAGLGQLYVDDERFTLIDGRPQPGFAAFMQKAMASFAQTMLAD